MSAAKPSMRSPWAVGGVGVGGRGGGRGAGGSGRASTGGGGGGAAGARPPWAAAAAVPRTNRTNAATRPAANRRVPSPRVLCPPPIPQNPTASRDPGCSVFLPVAVKICHPLVVRGFCGESDAVVEDRPFHFLDGL